MLISFFEEFPTKGNLEKLKIITWSSKLYLAAKSREEFEILAKSIKNKKIKEIIYWPILEKNEGYWFSPFTNHKALNRIFSELKNKTISVMLDLELPFTQNMLLFFTQLIYFWSNKKKIKNFIEQYQGKFYLAEYTPWGRYQHKILSILGLDYKNSNTSVIKMMYRSFHNWSEEELRQKILENKQLYGNKLILAFGTIAIGIQGRERIISVEELKNDLQVAQESGIKEVVIFRLGGLTKEYVEVIKN